MSPNGIIPAEEAEKDMKNLFLERKSKRLTDVMMWSKRRDYGYAIRDCAKIDHINLIQSLHQKTVYQASFTTHITHKLICYTRKINDQ